MTLAYVFWHATRPGIDRDAHLAAMRRFHARLGEAGVAGLRASATFAVTGVPWVAGGEAAYEDWYIVDGFASLGDLNAAAVAGDAREPHDRAAAATLAGTAGLYAPVGGVPRLEGGHAHWFAGPGGARQSELLARLTAEIGPEGGCVWQRQLTLGPGPELCLVSPRRRVLPGVDGLVVVERTVVVSAGTL